MTEPPDDDPPAFAAASAPGEAAALVFSRPPVVVLDACVLFSAFLRDLLLHLAGRALVAAHWTPRILDETERNLVARSALLCATDPAKTPMTLPDARRISALMNRHFAQALLRDATPEEEARFPAVDPKDRHVAAAARAARLQLGFGGRPESADRRRRRGETPVDALAVGVITRNLADFPPAALAAHGLFVASPDAFLVALYRWAGREVLGACAAHAAGLHRPPMSEDAYLAKWAQLDLRVAGVVMGSELRLVMPAARAASAETLRQAREGVGGRTLTAAQELAARQASFDAAYHAAVQAAELAGIA